MLVWLPLATFVAHVVEEYPRFPRWATRHFGATSRAWYVYSHIVLITAMATIAWSAHAAPDASLGRILTLAIEVSLVANGLFHLVTTVAFRRYSPGAVTGTLLFFPTAIYMFIRVERETPFSSRQWAIAIALGLCSQALVIASLWLPLDLDWHLRRRAPQTAIPR